MISSKETIRNLELNIRWIEENEQHQFPGWSNVVMAMRDTLELLKEREPVEPQKENDGNPGKWAAWWYVCGNCGGAIDAHDRFCRYCGRGVKWE
jgi:hypothetical protein